MATSSHPELELLVLAATPGLQGALESYNGVSVISGRRYDYALRQLASAQPPRAIYLEDTLGDLADLRQVITTAQRQSIPVLLGLFGVGLPLHDDFADSGIPVATENSTPDLPAWIAEQLGLTRRAVAQTTMIAIGGAKGGVGKTLLTHVIAAGLLRRGVEVLVVDGDVANSGLRSAFKIAPGAPTYIDLLQSGPGAFKPERVRRHIYRHQPSGLHFLLGPEDAVNNEDLKNSDWEALMQTLRTMGDFPVVLLDTGPEMKKRPYALNCAAGGGYAIFPTPPSRQERDGVGQALRIFEYGMDRDLTERCFLIYMEPEKGVTMTIERIRPAFQETFPNVREIGVLPRAPRQVSTAVEHGRYICPLDVMSHSAFTWSVHRLVDTLCRCTAITPPQPLPRRSFWQGVFGRHKLTLAGYEQPTPLVAPPASSEVRA